MKALFVIALGAALLSACGTGPKSAAGFRLPDGDAAAGRQAFVDLQCYACHQVEGVDARFEGTPAAAVKLGGEVSLVKSYGQLVTSIINPSHRIAPGYPRDVVAPEGESLMEVGKVNDVMTVQQLTDLVAFLQSVYQVVPPQAYPYGYVYP
ncbi:MAG: c-type cytochrome [Chromatiales bacterium]|nr:c-type cytochrome [Chromatiales bacterium]